jgi:anti-sigma B factor antagonist
MISSATIERLPQGAVVVAFSGSLTLGSSLKMIESQVQSLLRDGSRIVFDLGDVEYIDSAGLGMMVLFHGELGSRSGKLRLCGVNPRVRSLLALTRTDSFLSIDASREESLRAFDA